MRAHAILAILTLCVLTLPLAAPTAADEISQGSEGTEGTNPEGETSEAEPKPVGPKVMVPEAMKDFGKVPRGSQLEHDFVVRNEGTEDLLITRVAPACGCTVAEYDELIAPGKSGKIHAEIDTTILGPRTGRVISVYTNDPERPIVKLVYDAELVPVLGIHPGYARYRVVHGEDTPGILKQWVYTNDGESFKVTGVDSPVPYLDVKYHLASEEERHPDVTSQAPESPQWLVELNLDYNDAPVGAIAQEVVIHTDHKVQKKIVIPVSGFVRPSMWATPHEVDLGSIEAGKEVSFSVVVQSFLTDPMEITDVRFDGKEVESKVSPVQEGRKYSVSVTLHPEAQEGPLRGKLQIRTSHPKRPVLEVPVRGQIL